MPSDYNRDVHELPQEPGASQTAGKTAVTKKEARETFRRSVGHGAAAGGSQQGGSESGDPTIRYVNALTWSRPLGRTGKFGTQDQKGKQPINYWYDLSSYMLEY